MRILLLPALLAMTLFVSGCYFTAGFSRTPPNNTVCVQQPGYDVTHYRPGAQTAPVGYGAGQGDCARPGYCCPSGLCGDAL